MTEYPTCTKCSTPLPVEYLNVTELHLCPGCSAPVRAEIFPAFFQTIAPGQAGEALVISSEASCFYHAQKKAAVVCATCGRFLCSLCDVELEGAHYCPSCLEAAQEKGKLATIDNRRRAYDTMALQLALAPLLIFWLTVATAPCALYIGIRHWNTPSSVVRENSKARMVIAIILASLQILGWIAVVIYFVFR